MLRNLKYCANLRSSTLQNDVTRIFSLSQSRSNNTGSMDTAPLKGVRILDMTRILAGPFCTMLLGDLGAEVIKVERPGQGDDSRYWGPPFMNKESVYFLSVNRNKKSIAVDFKRKEGQELIKQLAKRSDVLVENYLPGKLEAMGLGYEDLKKVAPQLIYCSITGFGQNGPHSHRAGLDLIAAGVAGLIHMTGPEGGEPCRVGISITDLSTGLFAYSSILAALIRRDRSHQGQHLDCSLLGTQVAINSHVAASFLNAGMEVNRLGTGHENIVPYQAFMTKEGRYMIIGAGSNIRFKDLCHALGVDELAKDPRYAENALRVKNRKTLCKALGDRFMAKTLDDWLEVFEGYKFPYGPVNNMQQVFENEQVQYLDTVQHMEHPTTGEIRAPGHAVKYSESPPVYQCPPPLLGQHTDAVLRSALGYDQPTIESLKNSKVI